MVRPASVSGCCIRCPSLCHWHYVHFSLNAGKQDSSAVSQLVLKLDFFSESPVTCIPRVRVSSRAHKASAALALCEVWVAALQ